MTTTTKYENSPNRAEHHVGAGNAFPRPAQVVPADPVRLVPHLFHGAGGGGRSCRAARGRHNKQTRRTNAQSHTTFPGTRLRTPAPREKT